MENLFILMEVKVRIYQVISLLGVPSVLTILCIVYKYLKSLRLGVQALLRAQMINEYNKYKELGYAPVFAKESFENCYKQYHNLGANGMMDNLRAEFLSLPVKKGG